MPIKTLMLDVDGVIVRPSGGRHWSANLQQDLGVDPAALQDCFFAPHWVEVVTGQADLHRRLAGVLGVIAPDITVERLLAYWFAHDAELDRRFLDDLTRVRSATLKVCLATNQEHTRIGYLMDTIGLRSYVDGCHYSAAIGHMKPQRAFFEAIQQQTGLAPSELLLVDDSPDNVSAAIASGWFAAHWTPAASLMEILSSYQVQL